jgi:hypothetical protein
MLNLSDSDPDTFKPCVIITQTPTQSDLNAVCEVISKDSPSIRGKDSWSNDNLNIYVGGILSNG